MYVLFFAVETTYILFFFRTQTSCIILFGRKSLKLTITKYFASSLSSPKIGVKKKKKNMTPQANTPEN